VADRRMLAKEVLLTAKRLLEKEEKALERVNWSIAHVTEILKAVLADDAVDLGHASRPKRGAEANVLQEEARSGVATLSLVPNPDGSCNVRINGGRAFRLPPKLGALLRILAAPGGRVDEDGLVGWKSYQHVAVMLGRRAEGRATHAHVTQTLWKLREAFTRESQNRFLIQRGPLGVRFALRRGDGT
jgi:hypothetical protein